MGELTDQAKTGAFTDPQAEALPPLTERITDKINQLTQSVWGVSNDELTEIVWKIDKLKQQLKLIK